MTLTKELKQQADWLYLLLAGLFIAALVTCNLIAGKFIHINLGFAEMDISAGVLPYPVTFLITDILSEIYGKKKTNRVVIVGLFCSFFVFGILCLGGIFPALKGSPIGDETYNQVFGTVGRVVFASMVAYLFAQLVDVRLFHFWKKLTNGKHLWLRNNASTIISQFVDTFLGVTVLFVGQKSVAIMTDAVDGWLFKVFCALADTVLAYLLIGLIRKKFKLKPNEEIRD